MRGMKAVSSVMSIAILLAGAVAVRAQDVPGAGYVQGTLGFTTQPEATPNHRISPPLGGTGFPGVAVAGGYFIRPSLAIEGELATGEVSVEQGFHYSWSQEYTAALRVTTIDGSVRRKPGGVSAVELVVGGGLARVVHATRDGIEFREYPYPQGSQTPMADSSWGDWVWNIRGGVDVVYPPASRVAFVGGGRLRWRQRNSDDDYRGVSAWALDFGAGLRVRF
jgi:hypothetical protein